MQVSGWRVVLAATAAFLVAGPAASDPTDEIKQQACAEYPPVETALSVLRGIGAQSTVSDLRAAADQLVTSYRPFAATARKVAKLQIEELDETVSTLRQNVQALPPEATSEQGKAMIKGDLTEIQMLRKQLLQDLGCPPK